MVESYLTSFIEMPGVKLPCVISDCNYQSPELEYAQSNEQLQTHIKYGHAAAGGTDNNSSKKPEKFPRPELKLNSSLEDWSEYKTCWEQYKEE